MKRVSRWLMSLCIAAMLVGTVGILPAKAADAVLKVTTPGNKVQTYQYQKAQDFVLNVANNSDQTLKNIKVEPVLKKNTDKWPFKTEYQSYEASIPELNAGDSGSVKFNFTQRDDAGDKTYRLTFAVTAENESGEKVYDDKVTYSVNTSAKPESQKEDSKSDNSGQSAGGSNDGGNMDAYAGGVDNGDAVYSGGGGGEASGNGSVPRVIVTGFTTNPADVKAGSDFTLTLHLKNTSKSSRVGNMLFELEAPTEGSDEQTTAPAFLPSSGSNSIYLDGIAANGTADISIDLNAKADLVQKPYSINVSMKYEDSNASQIEASSSISIPVKQDARFEFSEFEITPESIAIGEEANVSCNLYNLGRIKLYNAKAIFEGEDIKKNETFLGNLEPGSSTSIDVMLEGIQATQGDGQVKMTLSYEDEAGTVSTTEQTFNLTVTEATDDAVVDEMPEENTTGGLPIVPIILVILIIAGIVAAVVIKKKKKSQKLAEEEEDLLDELDGPSEDEHQ
ncbi:COG1361 S-layer family protein [Dorea ammoniilytica]|uniref:CARDB domain-containing protein n=1 Tax=Dorea ammoniilytica TaxID=2981788 RepID=A0ABT2S456_9FIRM|nr:hypothetical protein [Dorea ammoniilytica]MCU6699371.1 hypothetical protein [Dorea ammoniilytica]SCH28742.1 CARDB [uncultured Eubacterium sp.]